MRSDPTPDEAVADALARVARLDAPRVLSVIATNFRDLDLADEAVQEALTDAARSWPKAGIPANPAGWLMTVAKRRAIDVYRRQKRERQRLDAAAADLDEARYDSDEGGDHMIRDTSSDSGDGDERLRLILLCCHPALDTDAQVALTLRLVAGLTVSEISRAFLVPEATLAQRIVRAKRKIKTANMALTIPDAFDERVDAVLAILYLVFNEGYLAHDAEREPIRHDLVDEAVRLTALVTELAPESAEATGLLALERFHRARSAGRFDSSGDLVLLDTQDRSAWDLEEIGEANRLLGSALARMRPGRFQLEALIAAQHANARTAADTDWPQISRLYEQLAQVTNSAVVALNHAVAVAEADGPLAGLALVDKLDGLDDYHLLWAVRAELSRRAGRMDDARLFVERALSFDVHATERRRLERLLASTS